MIQVPKYKLLTEISIPLCSLSTGTMMHIELQIAPWPEIWSTNEQIHRQVLTIVCFWYNPRFDLKLKNRRWLGYQPSWRSNILKLTRDKTCYNLCIYLAQTILSYFSTTNKTPPRKGIEKQNCNAKSGRSSTFSEQSKKIKPKLLPPTKTYHNKIWKWIGLVCSAFVEMWITYQNFCRSSLYQAGS